MIPIKKTTSDATHGSYCTELTQFRKSSLLLSFNLWDCNLASSMKWKVHELMDGLMPSNIKAFLCFHIFQQAIIKISMKKLLLFNSWAVFIILKNGRFWFHCMPILPQQALPKLQLKNKWNAVSSTFSPYSNWHSCIFYPHSSKLNLLTDFNEQLMCISLIDNPDRMCIWTMINVSELHIPLSCVV